MVIIIHIASIVPRSECPQAISPLLRELVHEPMLTDPMPRAQEVDEVSPGILVWQAYDSKVKADLFSTALETRAGTYVVDPIPLTSEGPPSCAGPSKRRRDLCDQRQPRAGGGCKFAKTLAVPIYAHRRTARRPGISGQ